MTTCVRRKPIITYQSPSANDSAILPRTYGRTIMPSHSCSEPADFQQSTIRGPAQETSKNDHSTTDLPLFHPLGRLATALPPFDPRPHGLPLLPERWTKTSAFYSRHRRVASQQESSGKPFNELAPTTSAGQVNLLEIKAKFNHRRSRKRKRMDAENDTTYPARKTRVPRESSHGATETTPIDKMLNTNGTEALADHLSTDVGKRLSPAQTSVKELMEPL